MSKYKVYEYVWILWFNKAKQKQIFGVFETMDFDKTGVETSYFLVDSKCGAGRGNNSGDEYTEKEVFATKEDLLQHVVDNF